LGVDFEDMERVRKGGRSGSGERGERELAVPRRKERVYESCYEMIWRRTED
jgi:hypothetical protein